MNPTTAITRLVSAGAVALVAGVATAQPLHDTDIIIGLTDESVITFANAEDAVSGDFGQRVYVGELDGGGVADDPGYDSFSGTLPADAVLGYNIVGAVRQWDGSAFPETPAASTMSIFKFGVERESPSGMDEVVVGTAFGQADGAGRFHHHVTFELNEDPGTGTRAPGVYLFGMQITSLTDASVTDSDTVYLIWDFGADPADVNAARDWANANLVGSTCVADWNGDGTVNILDVVAFINTWNVQGAGSDFNNDGGVNVLDVIGFINAFNAGCV